MPNGGQFYKRWFASTGVLLIKAPLLSLFVPQQISVCSERPNQDDLLAPKDLMELRGRLDANRRQHLSAEPGLARRSRAGEKVTREGKVVITM